MKKSLVLAMAMALGVTASAYAANPFSDVPAGHWAYDSVAKLAAAGVVDGYADGAFDGDKLMTRYEMAQIVAKAMAKGADVDKLAAEFADELDTLGVRVAKLEKSADAVKVTGQVRYHYAGYDGDISGHDNALRSRIWIQGQINDDWTYTGMIQNTQDFTDDVADEDVKFQRAYVQGKLGGLDVTAGRWNHVIAQGNLYDTRFDGVEASYGNDVKVTAFYGKPTDMDERVVNFSRPEFLTAYQGQYSYLHNSLVNAKYENAYGAKVETKVGVVDAEVGYTVFKDGGYKYLEGDGKTPITQAPTSNGMTTVNPNGVLDDNKVWYIGANLDIAKDFNLSAMYLKSDLDGFNDPFGTRHNIDDDGYVVGLAYKGAMASVPGSYGVYANYYDQGRGTVMAHTMDGYYGTSGFEGWMIGANYAFAKNIVAKIEYYDLESKGFIAEGWPGKEDMETLWAEVVFTF